MATTYADLFYDNFELPAAVADVQGDWSFSDALNQYVLSTTKFAGKRSLRLTPAASGIANLATHTMATARPYAIMGFRGHFVKPFGGSFNFPRIMWMRQPASDDGVRVYLQEENGNVRVAIGSTVLGVVADYVLTDEEAYYELEAYSHAVSGFVALYRDGAEIWSYTGDTSGMGDVSRMIIRSASYSGTEYLYARDFYCCGLSAWDAVGGNNLGPCQVHSAPVDAAVGTPDFTPSAGNNEDNLPIPHNVDVTYNQSNTNDHEDRFTVDLSARPAGTIFAAGVELAVKQAVAGSTEIRSTMSINSVRTTGAKYLPAAAYEVCLSDITQSPGSLTDLDYIGYQNQAG